MNDFEDRLHARMQDLRSAIEPPPGLWARVEQRAERRPWIPITMVAVAAGVLIFAAVVGLSTGGGGSNKHVVAAGPPGTDTSTTQADNQVQAPPTSQAPTPQPTTSTTSVFTAPTNKPAPTTTTTILHGISHPVRCAPDQLGYTIATDQPSYATGTTVHFTLTERNVSAYQCTVPTGGCPQTVVRVFAADGTKVWDSALPPGFYSCPAETFDLLQPGQAQTSEAAWDQRNCPTPSSSTCTGGQVPVGSYSGHGLWRDPPGGYIDRATTSFSIT